MVKKIAILDLRLILVMQIILVCCDYFDVKPADSDDTLKKILPGIMVCL